MSTETRELIFASEPIHEQKRTSRWLGSAGFLSEGDRVQDKSNWTGHAKFTAFAGSSFTSAVSRQAVRCHVVVRVFGNVHFNQVTSLIQQ